MRLWARPADVLDMHPPDYVYRCGILGSSSNCLRLRPVRQWWSLKRQGDDLIRGGLQQLRGLDKSAAPKNILGSFVNLVWNGAAAFPSGLPRSAEEILSAAADFPDHVLAGAFRFL